MHGWDHRIAYDEAAWLTGLTNTELQLDSWAARTATGRIVYCVFSGVPQEGIRKGGDLMVGWICHIWRTVVQEISAQALETIQYLVCKGR